MMVQRGLARLPFNQLIFFNPARLRRLASQMQ